MKTHIHKNIKLKSIWSIRPIIFILIILEHMTIKQTFHKFELTLLLFFLSRFLNKKLTKFDTIHFNLYRPKRTKASSRCAIKRIPIPNISIMTRFNDRSCHRFGIPISSLHTFELISPYRRIIFHPSIIANIYSRNVYKKLFIWLEKRLTFIFPFASNYFIS